MIVTSADGPYQTIRDLVIAAKAKPDEITFASAGVGSSTHLATEYFNQTMGIKLIHVPYKGSPEAIQDAMSWSHRFLYGALRYCYWTTKRR
ncbi:tripartite tricarboxylate transporter substrate-binding protein [Polynucleobacter necessarius]|uniref:tripartite tricarboxylate transporter substrate-binding protein n=1 Tax=Polynucleobacter necessarius TaxID=576610 RepID=UPI0022B25419|nr:tripartite tricarboxylate transporter substrate-binding protein [Polynucleobacter necessarius]